MRTLRKSHFLLTCVDAGKNIKPFIINIIIINIIMIIIIVIFIVVFYNIIADPGSSSSGFKPTEKETTGPSDYDGTGLQTILSGLAPKRIIPKRISVNRETLLNDSITAFKSANFDYDQPFRITFENEPAIDGGGPMREYFSLLLRALVSSCSHVRLFEGREHSLLPMHNTDALRAGLLKVAGCMIACSIINGSDGFPCLASSVFSYLVTQTVEDAVEGAVPDDIPDAEVKQALEKVCLFIQEIRYF